MSDINPPPASLERLVRAMGVSPHFAVLTTPDSGYVGVETDAEMDTILKIAYV